MWLQEIFHLIKMGLSRHKSLIYLGVLCLGILIAFFFKMGERKNRTAADFALATHAFTKWTSTSDQNEEEFKTLSSIIKKHPELKPCYEGKIAQNFMISQETNKAKEYGKKVILRVNQPYYQEYGQTSLYMGEKKFEKALLKALALKKALLEDNDFWENQGKLKSFGSALFAFNLMRIAFLYQYLDQKQEELKAWQELKNYAGWNCPKKDKRIDPKGFEALLSHFSVEDITLIDYISYRENACKK